MKGYAMSETNKFEEYKRRLVNDNERKYGAEIREKYGDDAVDRSNAKVMGMTEEQRDDAEKLSNEIREALKAAFEQGDPAGGLARKACELHKRWLCYYWDTYSKEAHIGLARTYVDDLRFAAYYDGIAPGCAAFLRDAINIYCV
jgi:hypothetical protein